uniref:Uncharacterized protein n=1 Tax=Magallana gigas TaxID=29159 RepID=K1Q9D4_MAGGI
MDYYLGNWRSLVDEIEKDSRDEQHLTTAIQWYENEASSRYGCQPQWNELLTCLLHKEPVIKNGVLEFDPVFHLLNPGLQSTFLQLLLHFRHVIPRSELLPFIRDIAQRCEGGETWLDVYVRMLAAHCQLSDFKGLSESGQVEAFKFSPQNEERAAILCQQLSHVTVPPSQSTDTIDSTKLSEAIEITEEMESEEPNVEEMTDSALESKEFPEPLNTATKTSLMKLRECWQMECIDLPEEFSLFYTSTPDQLSENISRPLLGLLKKMGEEIPKPLVDGIFVPLVMSTDQCSSTTEIICKIMKESMQAKDLIHMVRKLNSIQQELTESHIPMEDEDLTTMLETLKRSSTNFSKNLKFGKLILATVNIYGDQRQFLKDSGWEFSTAVSVAASFFLLMFLFW